MSTLKIRGIGLVLACANLCADAKGSSPRPELSNAQLQEAKKLVAAAHAKRALYQEEAGFKVLEGRKSVQQAISDGHTAKAPCFSQTAHDTGDNKGCKVYKHYSQADLREPVAQKVAVEADQLIVFVSFSLPEASLKALFAESAAHPNVKLVLRGLLDDSIQKTAQKIEALGGVLDVDPERFETYGIEQVPTFVHLQNNQPKAKLSGNVTIGYAKTLFAQNKSIERKTP